MSFVPSDEKIVETHVCQHCQKLFDSTDADAKFYKTLEVPSPTWCPECRLLRKMAWSNEGVLYQNQCHQCKKNLISYIRPEDARSVLCLKCFFSDGYDPLSYGKKYDPSRSFFEQLHEIESGIPHLYAAVDSAIENSDYIHQAGHAKNCYLVFHASYIEDCYYGYGLKTSKNCVDNHYCHESQFCYECIDVSKCNGLAWCQDCESCASSQFCRNCVGCSDCFLCVGLRNKRFHLMNKEYSPEEYKKKVHEFNTGSHKMVQIAKKKLLEMTQKSYFKNLTTLFTENSFGDHLLYSKNAQECFDCSNIEDCKRCYQLQLGTKDSHDIYQYGVNTEWSYECAMVGYNVSHCRFCYMCDSSVRDMTYCINSTSSQNCFGCVGLKKEQYCILNTQYTEEEYKKLSAQIIADMTKRGEWGEFFPVKYSLSAYNETIAQEWYPKTKEEVLSLGWKWQDQMPGTYGKETLTTLPDDIKNATPEIVDGICKCETCSKNYRIIPQELDFLYKNSLPLPHDCFDCRRKRRFEQRNKRTVRDVACSECAIIVPTTYPLDFGGKLCCEDCYRKIVY